MINCNDTDQIKNIQLVFLCKYHMVFQVPRRDSGSAGTKKVLAALEKETKANFQEKINGKV